MFTEHRARVRQRIVPVVYKQRIRYGSSFVETNPDSGVYVKFTDGNYIDTEPYSFGEITADEVHGKAPYRVGGPFENMKIVPAVPNGLVGVGTHITNNAIYTVTPFGQGRLKYVGGHQVDMGDWPGVDFDTNWLFRPSNVGPGLTTWRNYYTPSSSGLESTAWAKSMPQLEQGGLGVALAEARDVPRMLQTTCHGFWEAYKQAGGYANSEFLAPRHVADQFLNHHFGWVPFIGDLSKLLDNVYNGATKLDRLIKNNGTWTHVKKTLLESSNSELRFATDNGSMYFPANSMLGSMEANPNYQIWKTTHRHAYGVGRFRSYVPYLDMNAPEAQGVLGTLRRQLLLHGARLSPATVYRATKWTWLADWVSSSGSVVDAINASVLDGMASQYFYLCDTNTVQLEVRQLHPWNARSNAPRSLSTSRFYETKRRVESSPFGFSFAWDSLSPKQLAILGALGITRR